MDFVEEIEAVIAKVTAEVVADSPHEIGPQIAIRVGQWMRTNMPGTAGYIGGQSAAARRARHDQVRRMFNGRNATEIARKIGISRATVYRILKTSGEDNHLK